MSKRQVENVLLQHFGGIGNDDQSLTGSCHNLIVEYADGTETSVVVDMGAFQGLGQDLNQSLPFEADTVHAVILTHGHIDHCGRLPMLFNQKKQFQGDIYTSDLTRRVAHTALLDSAKIFATEYEKEKRQYDKLIEEYKEARRVVASYEAKGIQRDSGGNRNEAHNARPTKAVYDDAKKLLRDKKITKEADIYTKLQKPLLPIFTADDVETAVQGTTTVEYSENKKIIWQEICSEVSFSLWNAGHVAGSICILFRIAVGKAKMKYYFFSGDLGPTRSPLHPFGLAEIPTLPLDVVVMETTYGGTIREDFDVGYSEFEESVIKASKTRDRLIIPSFALDRAQLVLYLLVKMRQAGKIKGKIYLDSPLATEYTDLYQQHSVPESVMEVLKPGSRTFSLLDSTTRDGVLAQKGFKIIVTSSGMATGGPILTYLTKYLADIQTTFFFMGYMAEGTLGRDLTDEIKPKKLVRLPDVERPIEVLARVKRFNFLSGHMDQKDLWGWYKKLHIRPGTRIILVHGERDSSTLEFKHFLGRRKIDPSLHKVVIPEADKVLVPDVNEIYSVFERKIS